MGEQDGRGPWPERQPASGSTRNILIQGNAETQMQITGLNFASFWTAGWQLLFQIFALGVWGLLAAASGKPILRCFVEANVATTFVFLTFGIVFWFSEGGDYLSSRTNIFVVARTLFVGSFIPLENIQNHLRKQITTISCQMNT